MRITSGLTILLLALSISSHAVSNQAVAVTLSSPASDTITATSSATSAAPFAIPAGTPLSVTLLDLCWNKRDSLHHQQIIANYLLTKPKLPNEYEIAWKTARLVYYIGNFGIGEKEFVKTKDGVTLFDYGVQAGKLAKTLNPKAVEGYYWYAINLGSYGLAKGILAAASNAKDGMAALGMARQLDPNYQWYGSSRILGRYYQELPRIFGGDSAKALALLIEAATKAPNFKNNWVFLGNYYLSKGEYGKALEACNTAYSMPAVADKYEELRYKNEAKKCAIKAHEKLN